jgi:hypothetical protein
MSEELEQTVDVVPEDGGISSFRQAVMAERDEPEPEPVREPEPEPAPEPEAPPVEPDWLNAPPVQPPQQQQQQYQQQPQQYYEPPPQYRQPPPTPRTDAELQAFVDNPDAWFEQRIAAREQQVLGPLAQQQQAVAYMMQTMMENSVNERAAQADNSIRKAYQTFNKDATFRSNKAMQDKIGATLQGMRERAVVEARRGNFGPINALSNLSESDIAGTLAYVRAASGIQSPGVAPLQVEGATVESSRSAVAGKGVELTAEEQEIARRMGPGYEARMKKAKADQKKYDDLEWK